MVRFVRAYAFELAILALGLIASVIELLASEEKALGVMTLVIAFLLSATVLAIRKETQDLLARDLDRVITRIEPREWRDDAFEEARRLEAELREWADGRRTLRRTQSIPYQVKLLNAAARTMDAIHIATDLSKVYRWDAEHGRFSELVQAHEKLGKKVRKRRIFILDEANDELVEDRNGRRVLKDETVINVCRRQESTEQGGLGVELRILWRSDVQTMPPDMMIVDGTQVVLVDVMSEDVYETRVLVNQARVGEYKESFEGYFTMAAPVSEYLPPETPAGGEVRKAEGATRRGEAPDAKKAAKADRE
jgi:hypothetical protein